MALGFNNQPVNWDNSRQILAGADAQARGIEQLAATVTQGIEQYRKQRDEKQREKALVDFATSSGLVQDEAEGKAAIKAAGGADNAMQLIAGLDSLRQRRAAAQQRDEQAAAALRDLQLLADQVPTGQNMILDKYRGAGGRITPEVLKLADQFGQQKPQLGEVMDIRGVPYVRTQAGNISPLAQPKQGGEDFKKITIGNRQMIVGPGNKYFDAETGAPVDLGADRPISANDWLLSGQDPAGYVEYRRKFSIATKGLGNAEGFDPNQSFEMISSPAYKSPADVKAALKAGSITRQQAEQILKNQFGLK